jgi:hypothetical protein
VRATLAARRTRDEGDLALHASHLISTSSCFRLACSRVS